MPVRLVVAVTDRGWFDHLRRRPDLIEVNFWSSPDVSFRASQCSQGMPTLIGRPT